MSATIGRPRQYTDTRIQMQFRFTPTLRRRLRKEAKKRAVSVNLIVERAIEEYLDRTADLDQLVASNGE